MCSAVVSYVTPAASDNCGAATVTLVSSDTLGELVTVSGLVSGDAFPVGATTLVYQAMDSANLTSSCSFDITVADTERPKISKCLTHAVLTHSLSRPCRHQHVCGSVRQLAVYSFAGQRDGQLSNDRVHQWAVAHGRVHAGRASVCTDGARRAVWRAVHHVRIHDDGRGSRAAGHQ